MAVKVVTPPATEPLTLAEVKAHVRVIGTSDDTALTAMIIAAREHVESVTGRRLITQTWQYVADRFPDSGSNSPPSQAIKIPLTPVTAVSSVSYVDGDGATQTYSALNYRVDLVSQPARITPVTSWPNTKDVTNAVTVQFVVGDANAAAVPAALKAAMLLIVGDLYENREAKQPNGLVNNPTVDRLIWPYRLVNF